MISRRTVLTAGHCLGGVRNIFLGPQINGGAATKVAVVQEIRHPMYRDLPNDNATFDLGILKLGDDVDPTDGGCGCGCGTGATRDGGAALPLAVIALGVMARGRRRRARRS